MAKGGSFERDIVRKLSLWWTSDDKNPRDDIFRRTAGSGSMFTARQKKGKDTKYQCGDITLSDPSGQELIDTFSIELKTGYGRKSNSGIVRWDVLDYLDSTQKETVLGKMWKQCVRDAKLSNKKPLLIFRRNNRQPCIVFTFGVYKILVNYFDKPRSKSLKMCLDWSLEESVQFVIIMNFTDFLLWTYDIRKILPEIRSSCG